MNLDNLTKDEAMEIVRDQSNEHHGALYDEESPGHANIKAAVEKALGVAQGQENQPFDERELDGKSEDELRAIVHGVELPPKAETQSADPLGPVGEVEAAVDTLLKSEMGDEGYGQFIQAGGRGLQKLFGDDVEAMTKVIRASGILEDREALYNGMKLLAKLGGRK